MEFGELSADAGSLGHLASAKEKGKLLRRERERGETKLFGQHFPLYLEPKKLKQVSSPYYNRVNASGCAFFGVFVLAISQLSTKECVFVSEELRME